jgi:hypothetical protein
VQYLAVGAPNPLPGGGYYEICKKWGHHPTECPLLQKYQSTPKNLFCNFCKSVGHEEKDCRAFDLLRERTSDIYRIQEENTGAWMGVVCSITLREVSIRGTKKILAEAEVEGILVEEDEDRLSVITVINQDTWPEISRTLCTMCTYCRALDHATEDCPQLVAKWQARGNPNQNLHQNQNVQMISVEKCSEGPKITIVTCGGARTGVDMETQGNQIEQWVRKSAGPMPAFNPQQEKETYQSA